MTPFIPTGLAQLMDRGTRFLGCDVAILGGAMTWVSERNLVSAISNAGGFGVLACGAMSPELLQAEIQATRRLTNRPFGVNLITLHPKLEELADMVLAEKISHVVLAGGLPPASIIRKLKDGGAKVICFAPALVLARKLVKQGVDALIIEGMEAGGHIGPVATSVLVQEILPHIHDIPVFVAGGIGRGEAMLQYLNMGAAGVQLGTRFVCASESIAHPDFKQAFIRAEARDALPSVQIDPRFPVIPVRAIQNDGTRRFHAFQLEMIGKVERGELELKDAQLEIEHYWAGALRRAVVDGDVTGGSLMAGQSVGMVKAIEPVATIIANLISEAETALSDKYPIPPVTSDSTRITHFQAAGG